MPAPAIFETNHELLIWGQHNLVLIEAALAGNQKAYTELLKSCRKLANYLVLKIVDNFDDAHDRTLEVFTKPSGTCLTTVRTTPTPPGCSALPPTTASTFRRK